MMFYSSKSPRISTKLPFAGYLGISAMCIIATMALGGIQSAFAASDVSLVDEQPKTTLDDAVSQDISEDPKPIAKIEEELGQTAPKLEEEPEAEVKDLPEKPVVNEKEAVDLVNDPDQEENDVVDPIKSAENNENIKPVSPNTSANNIKKETISKPTEKSFELSDTPEPVIEIVSKDGKLYYQVDGAIQKQSSSKLVKIKNDYYYVLTNGEINTEGQHFVSATSSSGLVKEGTYSFYGNGKLVQISGIYKKDNNNWYFQDKGWALVFSKVVKNGSKYYLTNGTGKIYRNGNYQVSASAAAAGVKKGYYHCNADGTMEVSTSPTELKEALNEHIHVRAVGLANKVGLWVWYKGLNKNVTHVNIELESKNLGNRTLAEKNVKIEKGTNGSFYITFGNLTPNSSYSFSIYPYYKKTSNGRTTTSYMSGGSTSTSVKTTSANQYKAYSSAKAQDIIFKALSSGKTPGFLFVKISAADASKLKKHTTSLYNVFTSKLLSDSTKRLGSLLNSLSYKIDQGDIYKSGNKWYLGINAKSKASPKQLRNYKKMVKWYNGSKIKTKGKSTKQKCKVLAKYLMDRCSYDYAAYNRHNRGDYSFHNWCYDAEGAVLHKKAVCAGYSEAFKKMCLYAGVKCEVVESPDHSWNLVKVGKKWYHYDVTWNDCVGSQKAYSFMGSKQASRESEHKRVQLSKAFKKTHPIAKNRLAW